MIDLSDMCTYVTLIILIHFVRLISDYNKKYKCYNKYDFKNQLHPFMYTYTRIIC